MQSLRRRLSLTYMLVALVGVLIVAALTTTLVLRNFDRLRLQSEATRLSDRLSDYYQQNNGWDGVEQAIRRYALGGSFRQGPNPPIARPNQPSPEARQYQLLNADGTVLFDSTRPRQRNGLVAADTGIRMPIMVEGEQVGTLIVQGSPRALAGAESEFLSRLYIGVVGGSLLASLIAVGVGLVIARRLTLPLRSLTLAARRLAAGERHDPIKPPADTELADLASAFNTMAANLAHQEHLRRQMVADIAHELRTPLSVLRLRIEGVEDGIEPWSPQTLASLGYEVNLLSRLVDDLRLLSLADAGQLSLTVNLISPADVVDRAAALATPLARQQGVTLQVRHAPTLPPIAADPQRLAQVLGNLLENALRYTPAGGTVSLSVEAAPGDMVAFEVRDTGPGIAPEDVPHIFDRFYRANRARTRETGGSGLGLAIVQRLVGAHGGSVHVESVLGQGTTFRVLLPGITVQHPQELPLLVPAAR